VHARPQVGVTGERPLDGAHGDDRVDRLGVGLDELEVLGQVVVDVLVDVPLHRVEAGPGDVVVRAPEPWVQLEELRLPVAGVVLEVEVRIADPLELGEQPHGLVDDLAVLAGEDRGRNTEQAGRVLLDERAPIGREADLGVPVAVAREDPHARVVAGDHVLQDQLGAVARPGDPLQQAAQLLGRRHLVDLGLALERHRVPRARRGRLEDQGIAGLGHERVVCRPAGFRVHVEDRRGRDRHPGPHRDLGEGVLAGGDLEGPGADVGHLPRLVELLAHGVDDVDQGVRCREQDLGLGEARKVRPLQRRGENDRVVGVGTVDDLEDRGVVGDPRRGAGDDERLHAVLLMEGAHQRVATDVGTDDHGDERLLRDRTELVVRQGNSAFSVACRA